jgi:predicted nucleic acid-binding protein
LLGLLENGALTIALQVEDHVPELRRLLRKYRDQPMSLADACIVRMAELFDRHLVLTLDSDFLVYRKQGRLPLALIHPTQ